MTVASLKILIGADWSDAKRAFKDIGNAIEPMARRLQDVGKTLTTRVTLPLAALGAASIKAAGEIESMELALKAVMGSSEAAAAEVEKLRKVAENPGLGFGQVVKASLQLQNVGMSADEARQTIIGLGNAIALSGGTASDFGEVSRQLSQIASLGRVTAENLNVILERSPAMAQALQRAFGTTSAEAIRELGLSSEEFLRRLTQGLAALPRAEGGILNSLSNAADNLRIALVPLGKEVAALIVPALESLTEQAARLGDWFGTLDAQTRKNIVRFGVLLAAIGPVLTVLGTLGVVIAGLSAPLLATAAGLGMLAAAGYSLVANFDSIVLSIRGQFREIDFYAAQMAAGVAESMLKVAVAMAQIPGPAGSMAQGAIGPLARMVGEYSAAADSAERDLQRINAALRPMSGGVGTGAGLMGQLFGGGGTGGSTGGFAGGGGTGGGGTGGLANRPVGTAGGAGLAGSFGVGSLTPEGLAAFNTVDLIPAKLDELTQRIIETSRNMSDAIRDGLGGAIAGFAEGLGQMAVGAGSLSDLGRTLLSAFGGIMQKLGGMLITFGLAGLKFQAAGGFLSFLTNPAAAIAVGGLLVAAGSAIRATLSQGNRSSGAGGGFTGVTSAGNTGGGLDPFGGGGAQQRTVPATVAVLPSGDLEFSLKEGGRRLDRYGTGDI